MKTSAAKKAFADPQSLAVTAGVAADLLAKLQQTPLQIDQRLQQLTAILLETCLFSSASCPVSKTSVSEFHDVVPIKNAVQVLDQTFGAGLDFLLTWKLWLQARV